MITFFEDEHKYINQQGEQYTSVTTLIEDYTEEFNGEYWSYYKAIERFMNEEIYQGRFDKFKKDVGGYQNVVPSFRSQAKTLSKNRVNQYQAVIKNEWFEKNKTACDEGTVFHKTKEDYWHSKEYHDYRKKKRKFVKKKQFASASEITDGIYSELLLYNHKLKLAGQADLVVIDGKYIDIEDYKTNKELKWESFRHKKMKAPLDDLDDCNISHYNIQLSIYGRMLELINPSLNVRNITIHYAERDEKNRFTGKVKPIQLSYLKRQVDLLFEDRYLKIA